MADRDDVRRIALALPGAVEVDGRFAFAVDNRGKLEEFVWVWMERVDPKKARIPNDAVIGVRVANAAEKAELLAADAVTFFTEPHYNGHPSVLVRLGAISPDELGELITDAWRCQAPRAAVRAFDASA